MGGLLLGWLTAGVFWGIGELVDLVWTDLPDWLGIHTRWYPLVVCSLGGLLVGLGQKYLGDHPAELNQTAVPRCRHSWLRPSHLSPGALHARRDTDVRWCARSRAALVYVGGTIGLAVARRLGSAEATSSAHDVVIAAVFGAMFVSPLGGAATAVEDPAGAAVPRAEARRPCRHRRYRRGGRVRHAAHTRAGRGRRLAGLPPSPQWDRRALGRRAGPRRRRHRRRVLVAPRSPRTFARSGQGQRPYRRCSVASFLGCWARGRHWCSSRARTGIEELANTVGSRSSLDLAGLAIGEAAPCAAAAGPRVERRSLLPDVVRCQRDRSVPGVERRRPRTRRGRRRRERRSPGGGPAAASRRRAPCPAGRPGERARRRRGSSGRRLRSSSAGRTPVETFRARMMRPAAVKRFGGAAVGPGHERRSGRPDPVRAVWVRHGAASPRSPRPSTGLLDGELWVTSDVSLWSAPAMTVERRRFLPLLSLDFGVRGRGFL